MLTVEGLDVFHGDAQALDGVSLEVAEGAIVAIVGANGAGKSSLIRTIAGMHRPARGRIVFRGRDIAGWPSHRVCDQGIGQVPEGRHIFPQMSVLENLEMGAYLRNDKAGIKADIEDVFGRFPILGQRRTQAGGTLSGGEQQMLAISRALLARPSLLLLDEPSLGLAPLIIKQIFEIIKKINAESNTTVFLVEQNANQALKIAHRGYVMENGAITLEDRADALLSNEDVKKAYLGM